MIETKTLLKIADAVMPITDMGNMVGAKWTIKEDRVYLISAMNKPVEFSMENPQCFKFTLKFIAKRLCEKNLDEELLQSVSLCTWDAINEASNVKLIRQVLRLL